MNDPKRAAEYRQRADALSQASKSLPPEQKAAALRQQNALNYLADIEDWVRVPPRRLHEKHDLGLEPSPVRKLVAKLLKPRGRRAQPQKQFLSEVDEPVEVVAAPSCPECSFSMTPVSREGANARLPKGPLFECRACGIMVARRTS